MSLERQRALFRRGTLTVVVLLCCADVTRAQGTTPPPAKAVSDLSALDLEQLMKMEVVVAGSKREQQMRDVPSFVSIVTAAEIKAHGFRTLADVLRTLPSFYVSNDRNYSFVGVRGFERSGDYNSRVLLLLNGLRTNDNVYDDAYIGEAFNVDMELVDRIEVIRGPSAALYGSNAFFAVINVITKRGGALQGGEVSASAASFGTYAGRASYGRTFNNDLDVLVSASYSDSKGRRLYFPEFDSPSTNNGISDGADGESFHRLLATVNKGNFSFQASNSSRDKAVPTGSFGTIFNDPRTHTVDGISLTSLSYRRALSQSSSFSARVNAGRWVYTGAYPSDPILPPSRDEDVGEWWGAEVDATHALSRHFVTVGAEFRDNFAQNQKNYDPEPYLVYTDLRNASTRWGMFAQDEITLFKPLMLYGGLRYDRYDTFGSAMTPRVGLIYTPGSATTIKVLAGRAFRAPNEYELHYESNSYEPNPRLQPEHIATLELVAQRLIGHGVQVTASTYRNQLSELINQRVDSADNDRFVFENADKIASRGIELGLEVNRGYGPTGSLSYTVQRTENSVTHAELTSSPRQMAKLQLLAPFVSSLSAGVDAQYMSGQRTVAGHVSRAYTVTNLSLLAPHLFNRVELSATIYNLFGVTYGTPGSEEHLQDVIQQDGRSFRVKSTLRF